ncbi:hypothetical protein JCM17724A_07770 [Prevotella fusca JCM 17724]
MKRFSASEGDNKVGSQDRLGYAFCLINNFGSSDKAVREVSTHLTDEPKYSFNHKQTPQNTSMQPSDYQPVAKLQNYQCLIAFQLTPFKRSIKP